MGMTGTTVQKSCNGGEEAVLESGCFKSLYILTSGVGSRRNDRVVEGFHLLADFPRQREVQLESMMRSLIYCM